MWSSKTTSRDERAAMMKSVWKSLGMIAMLLAVLYGAGSVYVRITWEASAAKGAKQSSAVKKWGKPDLESLAAYGLAPFETTLPAVFIDTGGQRITKENKIWATVAVLNNDPEGRERSILETPDYQQAATVKYRGASSYSQFDKPQYRIKFYKREGGGKAENIPFLGMGEHSEWVLNGPFLDKTLIRNRLVYGIGRVMFEWAPDARFVEVFVDGEYQGVYLAVEPVTNGASRLRLSEFGLLSGEMAYIVKRDRVGSEENPLEVYGKTHGKTNNDLFVEYPAAKNLTDAQEKWIQEDISAFERALYGDRFDDISLGYRRHIDLDCFADYVVLNEVFMNHDGGNLSTYVYKELGGKLKLAIWDYNNCSNNYQWFSQDFSEFCLADNAWFSRLVQDRAFVERVVERYWMWRESLLSNENLFSAIDGYQRELGEAIGRNFSVWGYSFDINMLSGARDIHSYEEAVGQFKDAIETRLTFLDGHIVDLYGYCVN